MSLSETEAISLLQWRCRNKDKLCRDKLPTLSLSLSRLELANRAGGSGWAGPTLGQGNNRADRAGLDLNRAAISLTQPGPISG